MKQFYFLLLIGISIVSAQVQPTTSEKIDESLIAKQAMDTNSLVKNIPLKNIFCDRKTFSENIFSGKKFQKSKIFKTRKIEFW